MPTTIQVKDQTLLLLKKWKDETHAKSYDEALHKIYLKTMPAKSMAGSLKKYFKGMAREEIFRDIRDEHDRF